VAGLCRQMETVNPLAHSNGVRRRAHAAWRRAAPFRCCVAEREYLD
jgi:hypothetical protein